MSLLLVVGVGELALRILTMRNDARIRAVRADLREAEGALPVLTGTLGISRPNLRGIHKGVLVRTDSSGLRGPERGPAEPGVTRLITAGDSFTFGSGTAEADIYATRLPSLLDQRRPGERHEVINAGLSGGHIDSIMKRLESAIGTYRPGLFVYGYTMNDIEGPDYVMLPRDANTREWLAWAGKHPLLIIRFVTWRFFTISRAPSPAEERYPRELMRNYFENERAWSRVLEGLDRFAAMTEKADVCGHLLLHTQLQYLDDEHPFHPVYERVAEAARARGLTVTDPFPAYAGHEPKSLWISEVDSHPNAEGHRILAEQLAEDLLALPERCWQRAALVTTGQE
jgi:lysophospholipase L1-like esterase